MNLRKFWMSVPEFLDINVRPARGEHRRVDHQRPEYRYFRRAYQGQRRVTLEG